MLDRPDAVETHLLGINGLVDAIVNELTLALRRWTKRNSPRL